MSAIYLTVPLKSAADVSDLRIWAHSDAKRTADAIVQRRNEMSMYLTDHMRNILTAERAVQFANSSQISLGQFIKRLEACKPDSPVYFDFANAIPRKINSWRGLYHELALGFDFGDEAVTVQQLLEVLHAAEGKTFKGYKGGGLCHDERDTHLGRQLGTIHIHGHRGRPRL